LRHTLLASHIRRWELTLEKEEEKKERAEDRKDLKSIL
jgi:hypothetical protein